MDPLRDAFTHEGYPEPIAAKIASSSRDIYN
jgi:hypothetical protein